MLALNDKRRLRAMPTQDLSAEREYIRSELAYLGKHNDFEGAGFMVTFYQGWADKLDAEISRRARAGLLPVGGIVPTWGDWEIRTIKDSTGMAGLARNLGLEVTTRGTSRASCLCPFHNDHEPSLMLYEESKQYHCFSCGAHGDGFDLYQKITGKPFPDAVRQLAAWAGITLPGRATK